MAIATLGTQQPGQDYSYQQFEYTPAAPPDPMEELYRQAFQQLNPPPPQPRGPTPFWENPATYYPQQQQVNPRQVQQAQEMIAQAMQYQGIRGYQRDLESGKSAAEAMAKWGPMLFAQDNRAFAPSMNALTPPPTKPQMQWIPANPQTGEPAHWSNTQSIVQPRPIAAQKPPVAPKLNPVDDATLREANRNISVAMGQLKKPDLLPADREQALGMLNLARTERNKIAKKYGFDQFPMGVPEVPVGNVPPQMPQAPHAPVTAETAVAPQPQQQAPFKEGTRVRNKSTGKYFRIVNGQPVPE